MEKSCDSVAPTVPVGTSNGVMHVKGCVLSAGRFRLCCVSPWCDLPFSHRSVFELFVFSFVAELFASPFGLMARFFGCRNCPKLIEIDLIFKKETFESKKVCRKSAHFICLLRVSTFACVLLRENSIRRKIRTHFSEAAPEFSRHKHEKAHIYKFLHLRARKCTRRRVIENIPAEPHSLRFVSLNRKTKTITSSSSHFGRCYFARREKQSKLFVDVLCYTFADRR